ncbi:hypothetical protein [Thermogemmatispora sp.]|uniref:hypothetical protein n=1 Tax=Thermogemmatispora sp. TaxID=1968838 RepID=UPI0035E44005
MITVGHRLSKAQTWDMGSALSTSSLPRPVSSSQVAFRTMVVSQPLSEQVGGPPSPCLIVQRQRPSPCPIGEQRRRR